MWTRNARLCGIWREIRQGCPFVGTAALLVHPYNTKKAFYRIRKKMTTQNRALFGDTNDAFSIPDALSLPEPIYDEKGTLLIQESFGMASFDLSSLFSSYSEKDVLHIFYLVDAYRPENLPILALLRFDRFDVVLSLDTTGHLNPTWIGSVDVYRPVRRYRECTKSAREMNEEECLYWTEESFAFETSSHASKLNRYGCILSKIIRL